MRRKIVALMAALAMLSSCSVSNSSSIKNVDATSFLDRISTPGVQVIDVRSSSEFSSGHLVGALNLDVESGELDRATSTLDKDVTYALYCRSGRRSTLASEKLAAAGFKSIINFNQGGFAELANAGASVE